MKTKPCRRRPHSAPRSRRASNIRRPRFESLEDRRLLTVLFSENFPATSFSGANWSTIDDATIDSVGLGEPSSPYSARLNGNPDGGDRMESAVLNLSGQSSATLSYYYQRTGGGNGTETGDDLILEYKNSVGSWVELDRQPGSGADMSSYALRTVSLPSAALHSAFQFRFLSIGTGSSTSTFDDWFVDDIVVDATSGGGGGGGETGSDVLYLGMYNSGSELDTYSLGSGSLDLVKTSFSQRSYLEFSPSGTLYGASGSGIYEIDPNTGNATFVNTMRLNGTAIDVDGFTFTPGGALYIHEYSNRTGSFRHFLHQGNLSTGNVTQIGEITGIVTSMYGIEYAAGNLYGAYDNALYVINTSTAAAARISTLTDAWDMDYGTDGVMRGADPSGDRIHEINLATGALTPIATLAKEPWGIASFFSGGGGDTTPPTVTNRAPSPGSTITSAVTNIEITFSESVTGVDASDLVLTGSAGGSVGAPTNSAGNTWRFPISGLENGTLNLSLAPDADDIQDAAGNDLAHSTWNYIVALPGPAAPVLLTEPAITPGTQNTITWNPVAGAHEYYAEVDDDPSFSSLDDNSGWISGTSYTFTGLTPGETYYYRVKARTDVTGTTASWTQSSQAEFQSDVLSNVSVTSSPGDVTLAGGTGGVVSGAITNPSFESGSLSTATGWSLSSSGPFSSINVSRSTLYFATEGSYGLRFHTRTDQSHSPGQYIRLSQSVDLTGVNSIVFDVWNRDSSLVSADVLIDGTTRFSKVTSGTQNNISIDVSGLSGTHTLSIQETVQQGHSGPSAWVAFDNFRAVGSSGFVASGSVTSTTISPSPFQHWGTLVYNATTPANTMLTVDVLNSANSLLAADVPSGANLQGLGISTGSIKLRANLATTDSAATPALSDWAVNWQATPDSFLVGPYSNVVSSTQVGILINEVDADTPGGDMAEFVELYDSGLGNTSLDGYVLVFFNGSDDRAYRAVDLDGYRTDAGGFFVLGNPGVPNVDLSFPAGTLQNGADGVALYLADAADFPNGTPVHANNLVDAVVYDSNQADDAGLLAVLTPGQAQVNEDGAGNSAWHALARRPDGGALLDASAYTPQTPTPGLSNAVLPSTYVTLSGNNLLIADVAGKSDLLTLSREGVDLVIRDPNHPFLGGVDELRIPSSLVTGSILVQGLGADDLLTVDLRASAISQPIVYEGGSQDNSPTVTPGHGDTLRLLGGGQDAIYTPSATTTGNGQFEVSGSATITFTGLEPVDATGFATLTLSPAGGMDDIEVDNGFDSATGSIPALVMSGTTGGVPFESLHAWNNTTLQIITSASDDTDSITVNSAANVHVNANLVIDTGDVGLDTVAVPGDASFVGNVSIRSTHATLNAALSAGGTVHVSTGADMTMNAAALVDAGAAVTINAGCVIHMSDGARIANGGGTVDLDATGDITLGQVSSAGGVRIASSAGAIADGGDAGTFDISALSASLQAARGIGSGDALDTAIVSVLAAGNSSSGDIQITNSGTLPALSIGVVGGVSGVVNGAGSIWLAASDLNVTQAISATDDVVLASSNTTRTFALGTGPAIKGSGITVGTAAFALNDAELDLIIASRERRVIGDGTADQFNVNYGGSDTQPLHLLGLAGDDAFFVAPSGTLPINLDGGAPSAPSLPGDTLHLDMSAAVPVVIVDTIGGYASSGGTAVISFLQMESLDLCDKSGQIDNAGIGDLYIRTTNDRERITLTSWNDNGVKLRIDNFDTGVSMIHPQHFGLVAGQQMLSQLLVYAQDGNDLVSIAGHVVDVNLDPIPVEFHGENGDDYLAGADADDTLVGGPGSDRLLGGEGDNLMFGDGSVLDAGGIPQELPSDGNDNLSGRGGNDILFGGGGNDQLFGNHGNDYLHSGGGNDVADGGLDDDVLIGAAGDDLLRGNYGNDILLGGIGDDQLFGRQGDDVLLGGSDYDRVRGDAGNDLVVGGNASSVGDATNDAALRAILADWVSNKPTVPTGLGTLQLDGIQDLLVGDQGADAFHQTAFGDLTSEDRVDDFQASDGDSLL